MRAPFTRPQAPGSTHTLPDSDLCCLPPELEFAKSIMKIAEAGKVSIHQQSHMPLQYIYTLFLEHDLSLGSLAIETVAQQKRDYYQVREPCCPSSIPFAHNHPPGRHC